MDEEKPRRYILPALPGTPRVGADGRRKKDDKRKKERKNDKRKRMARRLLPLQAPVGGGVPARLLPLFQRVESLPPSNNNNNNTTWPKKGTLYVVGDNTSRARLTRVLRTPGAYALFEGTYHNWLALYSSLSRDYDRRAAAPGRHKVVCVCVCGGGRLMVALITFEALLLLYSRHGGISTSSTGSVSRRKRRAWTACCCRSTAREHRRQKWSAAHSKVLTHR